MTHSRWFSNTALISILAFAVTGSTLVATANDLEQGFLTPPDAHKPWVYWWWVKGNVTEESITRDLEEMKAKGIGGFLLFDARGYGEELTPPPDSPMDFLSPEWRGNLRFAIAEASRLGLKMSMNLSTHGGTLRAPWDAGDHAPKKLVWTSMEAEGPKRLRLDMRRPDEGRFRDVALVAARRREAGGAGDANLAGEWKDIEFDEELAGTAAAEVVDLTGKTQWDMPEGRWTLLRFAYVVMDGRETDVDILSAEAVRAHFERMGRMFLAEAGPLAGKTLAHFYNVSWEGASPTWTPGFEEEFQDYRGYDLRAYLPVLAGMAVENREVSRRFLEDYSRTLGDCFMDNCYGTLRELCRRTGLNWHSESGGPWDRDRPLFAHADQLAFWGRNDMPQGEFWHRRWEQVSGKRVWLSNTRRTAMAAHIYGRPLVAVEAFTHMNRHWTAYPAALKPEADAAFIDGANLFIWHTFDASPREFGKPGLVYFAGSHLNPNVTWWEQAGAFLDYLGRCQYLLRQGRFVSDVCTYTSSRNYLRWGRDKQWSEKPSLMLGEGYKYDLINTEVLLERLSVEDGNLVLPDGMRYRMLVVDLEEEQVPPEALLKMVELAEAGATLVLGRRHPERAPGLTDHSARDEEVQRLAASLWSASGSFGKGRVIRGVEVDDALREEGIAPDFEGPFEFIHRQSDDMDVYFVAGEGDAECTFRVKGREPELWDPVTGRIRDAVHYRVGEDGRTIVPIRLPENGSVFVVFRKPAAPRHLVSARTDGMEIRGRTAGGARVRLWRPGQHVLEASDGRPVTVETADLPGPLTLAGPWEVRFTPGWGAPESITLRRLVPWNEHPRDGIRHFSGTATYRQTFELDAAQAGRPLRLRLGEVKNIAEVHVNGTSLGVVWSDPWMVDLTGAVRAGSNELEVVVANLWVNRLIGDASLPEEKRFTKTMVRRRPEDQGRHPHLRGYLASDPLQPSGLLGPVRLEFGEEREVRF